MAKIKKIICLALGIRLLLIFVSGYHPDILNHVDWGIRFWQYGVKNFYEQIFWGLSWPNQSLGTMYLFALIAKLSQGIFAFLWFLNERIALFPSFIFPFLESKLHIVLLKLPFVLADLGLGWLIYKIVFTLTKKEKPALLATGLFLFNPALIYNSAVWGQTDSLINLLAVFGLWHLFRKNYFWGWLAFLFSFYFKLSLIIWLPVAILIVFAHKKEWQKILVSFLGSMALLLLISLPAVHHGNVFSWLWYLYTNRILPRQGNMLSGNAFNLWTLIKSVDLGLKEQTLFLGVKAKLWGFLLTGLSFFFSGALLFKKKKKDFPAYLWLMAFLSFSAFLFLTNMHERYLYPVFAPLAVLVSLNQLPLIFYLLLSLIHLLNLYNLWWYPAIGFVKSLLEASNYLLPRALSLVLIIFFGWLLVSYGREKHEKESRQ